MQFFTFICAIGILAVGFALGVRLLSAWRRTRGIPELALGVSYMSGCLGVMLLFVIERKAGGGLTPMLRAAWMVGIALLAVGPAAMYIGVWRIFRGRSRWAFGLAVGGNLAMLVWTLLRIQGGDTRIQTTDLTIATLYHTVTFVSASWILIECFLHHDRLKRRVALGLGDAMIAHRFLLWGIAGVATVVSKVAYLTCHIVYGGLQNWPLGVLLMSILGITNFALVFMAFFPLEPYRRWVMAKG